MFNADQLDYDFYVNAYKLHNLKMGEAVAHFAQYGIFENRYPSLLCFQHEYNIKQIINRPQNAMESVACYLSVEKLIRDASLTKLLNIISQISKIYNCDIFLDEINPKGFYTPRLNMMMNLFLDSSSICKNRVNIYRGGIIKDYKSVILFGNAVNMPIETNCRKIYMPLNYSLSLNEKVNICNSYFKSSYLVNSIQKSLDSDKNVLISIKGLNDVKNIFML